MTTHSGSKTLLCQYVSENNTVRTTLVPRVAVNEQTAIKLMSWSLSVPFEIIRLVVCRLDLHGTKAQRSTDISTPRRISLWAQDYRKMQTVVLTNSSYNGNEITTCKGRTLTEHPNRPHAHEAPEIGLVGGKQQIEGEDTTQKHAHICLHLKDGVEGGAWLRWIFIAGTWCSRGKCCRGLSHCLQKSTCCHFEHCIGAQSTCSLGIPFWE